MNIRIYSLANLLTWVVLTAGAAAQAQQPISKLSKPSSLELTYDYARTNGPPDNCGCINLNGAGVAYVYPLSNSNLSLVGRLGASHAGNIGTLGYNLTLFTYTAGARYLPNLRYPLLQPYGEIQVGGVHASGTLANAPSLAGNGISSAFAATAGGGINLNLHRRLSIKLVDAEYLSTNYANGNSDHQNDVRISTGLILSFCGTGRCSTWK